MEVLQLNKDTALQYYKDGSPAEKALLIKAFGGDVFPRKPMEWVTTLSDACKAAGEEESNYAIPATGSAKEMMDAYAKCLGLFELVFNEGWVANIADTSQYKYSAWANVISDANSPFGFRLSYSVFDSARGYSHLGARPAFLKLDDAICAGKQHVGEFEQWLYYLNKMYQE